MNPHATYRTSVLSTEAPESMERALIWLRRGEVVAFPTDTVYGVGVPMDDPAAVERLYQVKDRPRESALPVLLAAVEDIEAVCRDVPAAAWRLAERFWPGGLTLVLWKRARVPDQVTSGRPSVAVRLPDHPVPRELARRLGRPLASSSANRSGAAAPVTAAQSLVQLGGRLPLILDGGVSRQSQSSTIVDLTTGRPTILREGPISWAAIAAALEK
jgi:L-threonylcarbamoyladenylate synthase